jgi:uncharacterized protein YdeI (YjbR/CyaY-like superfamily)
MQPSATQVQQSGSNITFSGDEPAMADTPGFAKVEITSRAELRSWLAKHHAQPESVWIVRYKKAFPEKHVSVEELVSEAICFGWIDSAVRKVDQQRSMNLLSPRRAGSGWSAVNKRLVNSLAAAGLIAAPGQRKIDQAKRDGSWSKLDAIDALETPTDLAAALQSSHPAAANFSAFPPSAKRGILEWISTAKTAPTRNKRIAETARLAAQNIRALSKDAKRT